MEIKNYSLIEIAQVLNGTSELPKQIQQQIKEAFTLFLRRTNYD